MDKRERHLAKTNKEEQKLASEMKSEKTPTPSGEQFKHLFNQIIGSTDGFPYLNHSIALNKDIILYRAMLIVLGSLIDPSKRNSQRIAKFMRSDAMKSLADNEYASYFHENDSRQKCFDFLKGYIE